MYVCGVYHIVFAFVRVRVHVHVCVHGCSYLDRLVFFGQTTDIFPTVVVFLLLATVESARIIIERVLLLLFLERTSARVGVGIGDVVARAIIFFFFFISAIDVDVHWCRVLNISLMRQIALPLNRIHLLVCAHTHTQAYTRTNHPIAQTHTHT